MRIILAAFYFIVLLSFSSCLMIGKSLVKPKNNLETIPQDFNPKKHVLLVAEMPKPSNPDKRHNGVTKKLDKELKKVYPYQYEIVAMKEILNPEGKYKDTSKYKYALVNNVSSYTRTTTNTTTITSGGNSRTISTSPSANVYSFDFRFYDRCQNKAYPFSGNSSSYLKYTIPAIVETINNSLSERKKTTRP